MCLPGDVCIQLHPNSDAHVGARENGACFAHVAGSRAWMEESPCKANLMSNERRANAWTEHISTHFGQRKETECGLHGIRSGF